MPKNESSIREYDVLAYFVKICHEICLWGVLTVFLHFSPWHGLLPDVVSAFPAFREGSTLVGSKATVIVLYSVVRQVAFESLLRRLLALPPHYVLLSLVVPYSLFHFFRS